MILLINPISIPITLSLLSNKGKTICRQKWLSNQNFNNEIIPKIKLLLRKAKTKTTQLTKIICLTGPGSYTNLRLALSTANIFGYFLKIPLYGFTLHDLELFSFLLNSSQVKRKWEVIICFKSIYSELIKKFSIIKHKKKQVADLFKDENRYKTSSIGTTLALNYSEGFLTVNDQTTKYPNAKISLAEQAENFVKQVILEKTAFTFKYIKPSEILLPVYYAPAVITKRTLKKT